MNVLTPPSIPSLSQLVNLGLTAKSLMLSRLIRRPVVLGSPVMLMVEPTTACQLKCPHCPTGRGDLSRPSGTMTYQQFVDFWDQIHPAPFRLQLWNQGEPLASKHTPDIIRHATASGARVIMASNVELLAKGDLAGQIVASGLAELVLSLDGATPESHAKYRVGGDFGLVEKAIQRVVDVKRQLDVRHPIITWQFLLFRHNLDEVDEAKRLAKEWGCNRIIFKTAQLEAFDRSEGETWLPDYPKLRRYDLVGDKWVLRRAERPFCNRIYASAVVQWDGDVVPCCFDKDGDHVVGNVFQQSFNQWWRGEKYRDFRRMILTGERPEMCANCTEGLRYMHARP